MNNTVSSDGDAPSEGADMQDLLRRLIILEQNQRDALFFLRSLRLALHNARVELSAETRRIHREVIRMAPFNATPLRCIAGSSVGHATRI